MKACGHVFKYGDNVDTDVIIPARYLNATQGDELALSLIHISEPTRLLSASRMPSSA